METAAAIAATLLGAIAVFQLALAIGAPWGRAAWGGQHPCVLPGRFRAASAFVGIVVYPLFVVVVLVAAGVVERDGIWTPVEAVMWGLTAFFGLGAVANSVSRSRPERVWGPVSLAIAVCCGIVAAGMPG